MRCVRVPLVCILLFNTFWHFTPQLWLNPSPRDLVTFLLIALIQLGFIVELTVTTTRFIFNRSGLESESPPTERIDFRITAIAIFIIVSFMIAAVLVFSISIGLIIGFGSAFASENSGTDVSGGSSFSWLGFLIGSYFAARVSLIVPASIYQQRLVIGPALAATKGVVFEIFWTAFITTLLFTLLSKIGSFPRTEFVANNLAELSFRHPASLLFFGLTSVIGSTGITVMWAATTSAIFADRLKKFDWHQVEQTPQSE